MSTTTNTPPWQQRVLVVGDSMVTCMERQFWRFYHDIEMEVDFEFCDYWGGNAADIEMSDWLQMTARLPAIIVLVFGNNEADDLQRTRTAIGRMVGALQQQQQQPAPRVLVGSVNHAWTVQNRQHRERLQQTMPAVEWLDFLQSLDNRSEWIDDADGAHPTTQAAIDMLQRMMDVIGDRVIFGGEYSTNDDDDDDDADKTE